MVSVACVTDCGRLWTPSLVPSIHRQTSNTTWCQKCTANC